jgi:hypothetical protein
MILKKIGFGETVVAHQRYYAQTEFHWSLARGLVLIMRTATFSLISFLSPQKKKSSHTVFTKCDVNEPCFIYQNLNSGRDNEFHPQHSDFVLILQYYELPF